MLHLLLGQAFLKATHLQTCRRTHIDGVHQWAFHCKQVRACSGTIIHYSLYYFPYGQL